MAPKRHIVAGGQFIPKNQVQQVTIDVDQQPLSVTVRMINGKEHRYLGEEADSVRSQCRDLLVVSGPPAQQEAINDLPDPIRQHIAELHGIRLPADENDDEERDDGD